MLPIRLGQLLDTILVSSRIQGRRKLGYIRFKNSLIIEFFFMLENIVIEVFSDYCNFITVTYFVSVSFSFNKNKTSDFFFGCL